MQWFESSVPFVGRLTGSSPKGKRESARGRSNSRSTKGQSWLGDWWPSELAIPENPIPAIWEGIKGIGIAIWEVLRWGGTGWHYSKIFSLLTLLFGMATLGWLHQTDDFFVYQEDTVFSNLTYVSHDELYARSNVDGWSTFWLDRDKIREDLISHDYVADARITIGLPAVVQIDVVEQQPVAMWVTDTGNHWLLDDGTALIARHNQTQHLLHILDGQAAARTISYEPTINMDKEVLDNARKLATYFPNLQTVTFNSGFGLNFAAPDSGIWVYWGDGRSFETKLKNLLTIQNELAEGRIYGDLADLRVPEKPIVR